MSENNIAHLTNVTIRQGFAPARRVIPERSEWYYIGERLLEMINDHLLFLFEYFNIKKIEMSSSLFVVVGAASLTIAVMYLLSCNDNKKEKYTSDGQCMLNGKCGK
jgi:hypothetical protein